MKVNTKISKIIIYYIMVTYLLYLVGPIEYKFSDKINFFVLSSYVLIVGLTIYLASKSVPIRNEYIIKENITIPTIEKGFVISIYITYLSIIWVFYDFIKTKGIVFDLNIANVYFNMLKMQSESDMDISIPMQFYTLLSPLRYFVFTYGFLNDNWKRFRISFITLLIVFVLYNIFTFGNQKPLGDIIVIIIVFFIIKSLKIGISRKEKMRVFYAFFIFIVFFGYTQVSRINFVGNIEVLYKEIYYFKVNENNFLIKYLPQGVAFTLISFILYVSQGYHGLGLCLTLPFKWTYFIGSSRSLGEYLTQYLGVNNYFADTYPLRMEKIIGWPGQQYWPSAFSWWASDFTFLGALIFLFFLMRLFFITLKETLYYNNPISATLLSLLSIMVIYLPANNQLFQSRFSLLSFIFILIIWILTRNRFNRKLATCEYLN